MQALKPAATAAASGVERFNKAAAGISGNSRSAATGIKSFEAAATGAGAGTDRLSKAALSAGTAMGTVQRAAAGAVAPLGNLVTVSTRLHTSFQQADAHVEAYKASLLSLPAAANTASSSLARLGAAANDNINRLQSTPGNIAAQFQDIGVTAAAGMSPMLIALQQGTQLSSAMAGGVGNLLAGFKQLLSPTTLITIGLVGLVAAGLQMVDWIEVARSSLNFLADAIDNAGMYMLIFAGIMAIVKLPVIIAGIISLTQAFWGLAAGILATIGLPALLVAGLLAIVAAAVHFRDELTQYLGFDIVAAAETGINYIIAFFVGGFNAIMTTWKQLPAAWADLTIQAANAVLRIVTDTVMKVASSINPLLGAAGKALINATGGAPQLANPFGGAAMDVGRKWGEETGKAAAKAARGEYTKEIGAGIGSAMSWASGKLRGFADGLGGADAKKDKTKKAAGGMSEAEKLAKAYADIVQAANKRITALGVESKALDMSANAAHLYRIEQELIAQAVDKGITLTADQTAELKNLAAQISKGELNNAFKEQLKSIRDQQRALTDAGELIGKYGLELEFTKQRQTLINQAVADGTIDLDKMTDAMKLQVAMLENRAAALAEQSESNRANAWIEDMTKAFDENMFALRRERGELGLTGVALEAYRIESELLLDAQRKSIELGPQQLELLRQQALEYATVSEAIRKQREQTEFYRETFKGFFEDLVGGLREGQSVWEAFGNAVMNVVNRIIDRLLDLATDKLLNSLFNFGTSVLGGIGGGIGGGLNKAGGIKTGAGSVNGGTGALNKFALGDIFGTPQMFKFASGTALGQLGEAGPEAIMPLKRGPNGSLGVEMHGAAQRVHVMVDVNDDRFNAYTDDRADQRVAQAAPTLARAGANVAQSESMFTSRRRLQG